MASSHASEMGIKVCLKNIGKRLSILIFAKNPLYCCQKILASAGVSWNGSLGLGNIPTIESDNEIIFDDLDEANSYFSSFYEGDNGNKFIC